MHDARPPVCRPRQLPRSVSPASVPSSLPERHSQRTVRQRALLPRRLLRSSQDISVGVFTGLGLPGGPLSGRSGTWGRLVSSSGERTSERRRACSRREMGCLVGLLVWEQVPRLAPLAAGIAGWSGSSSLEYIANGGATGKLLLDSWTVNMRLCVDATEPERYILTASSRPSLAPLPCALPPVSTPSFPRKQKSSTRGTRRFAKTGSASWRLALSARSCRSAGGLRVRRCAQYFQTRVSSVFARPELMSNLWPSQQASTPTSSATT